MVGLVLQQTPHEFIAGVLHPRAVEVEAARPGERGSRELPPEIGNREAALLELPLSKILTLFKNSSNVKTALSLSNQLLEERKTFP